MAGEVDWLKANEPEPGTSADFGSRNGQAPEGPAQQASVMPSGPGFHNSGEKLLQLNLPTSVKSQKRRRLMR